MHSSLGLGLTAEPCPSLSSHSTVAAEIVLRNPFPPRNSTPCSRTAETRCWPHCALLSVLRAAKALKIGAGVTTRAFFQLFDHHGREQKCLVGILTPSVYIYPRSFAWVKRNRFRLGPWMLPSNPHLYCVKLANSQGDFLLGDKGKG